MDQFDSNRRGEPEQQVFGHATSSDGAQARVIEGGPDGAMAPIAAAPVTPPARHRRRGQWAIALGVVLVVALVSAAAAFVIVGGASPKSLTAKFAPKDSVAFATIRVDLPGDQRQKVASFLGHFPGFQDKAQFDTYFDKALNEITNRISPDFQYSTELKPWMGGELSIALESFLPSMGTGSNSSVATAPAAVGIVSVKDKAKAGAWLDKELAKVESKTTSETYAGATVKTAAGYSYALLDSALLVGETSAVKASLDAGSKGSLADVANFQSAQNAFSGDRVAFFYLDYARYMADMAKAMNSALETIQSEMPAAASALPMAATNPKCLTDNMPAWMAGSMRLDSSTATLEFAAPKAAKAAASVGNATSSLAGSLPGNTIAVFEAHSLGAYLTNGLKQLDDPAMKQCLGSSLGLPGTGTSTQGLDQIKGILSGFKWMGDGAVVLTSDAGKLGGGIVVQAPDAKQAQGGVDSITNMVSLLGGSAGIKSSEETYKGTTITVFSGKTASAGSETIAIATHDRLVVAGYGPEFVKSVIDTTAGNSLSSKSGYKDAMNAAGTSNTMSGYVDVQGALKVATDSAGVTNAQSYQREMQPYLQPVQQVAFAVIDGNVTIERIIVIVK